MNDPTAAQSQLKIRATRELRGISLRTLATEAGVSPGLISQVERGLIEPSLGTMRKVAEVLEVPLFSLLGDDDHEFEIIRSADRVDIKSEQDGIRYARLTPPSGVMEMLEGELSPHSVSTPQPHSHPAHECLVVVDGRLTVVIDADVYSLAAGDSCYFDSQHPHQYRNDYDVPVKYIMTVTPPSY